MTAAAILSSSGIYAIRNTINGKRYIGSAISLMSRWNTHKSQLRRSKHHSLKLQRAWDKNGESAFSFEVIEVVVDVMELVSREQFWIDSFKCVTGGYNCCPVAGSSLGFKASEETKKKMSDARQNVSKETRMKMSIARMGKQMPEHVKEMLLTHSVGKIVSSETRKKQSDFRKSCIGWSHSEVTKSKIGRKGELNSQSKLTNEIVLKVRELVNSGRKQCAVAEELNISRQAVNSIVLRRIWSHI